MKALKIFNIVVSIILILLFSALIFDILSNKDQYIKVYRINPNSIYWQRKSFSTFVFEHFLNLILFLAILIINISSKKISSKIYRKLVLSSSILLLVYFAYNFIMFITDSSGF